MPSPSAPGAWRRAKAHRSGSKSGSGRWSHWDEIGWVHYPEIGWSHSDEIRWVQSLEILQSIAVGDVRSPPTTSTSGIRWGGLNGWPSTTRSAWRQRSWNSVTLILDELDARIALGCVAASMAANAARLKSSRSGPFSCTNCAAATACSTDAQNFSRAVEAPFARPSCCTTGYWRSTASRSAASASGVTS
jgi:hypothetical protein